MRDWRQVEVVRAPICTTYFSRLAIFEADWIDAEKNAIL